MFVLFIHHSPEEEEGRCTRLADGGELLLESTRYISHEHPRFPLGSYTEMVAFMSVSRGRGMPVCEISERTFAINSTPRVQ